MHAAFALLPSAVVLIAVFGLGASSLVAAGAATASALLVWGCHIFDAPTLGQATRAMADAGVLTALVAAMIVPGLLFVEATRGRNSLAAIGDLVNAIGGSRAQAAILIATGIGVLAESLTGMGVSLLVTMPLLLSMLDRRRAIGLGLVGMSLMPWGALSISAHVGAKLSGQPVETLQTWIAAISGPVAFCLPMLCLLFVGERKPADFAVALIAGVILVASIALASRWLGVEVAGVAGGFGVIALMIGLSGFGAGAGKALTAPGLAPYLMLLIAVIAQKLSLGPLQQLGLSPALATSRVDFAILTSPGLALLAATLLTAASALRWPRLKTVFHRAWRPVVSVALFMFSARLLVESGAIAALARSLGGLGPTGATVAVAMLGAVGGFVTGSGVTGNALFMPSAAAAGEAIGAAPLFAALQNAASGHVGMAALPVAAILLATLTSRQTNDASFVMRTSLALAAWHVSVATIVALILLHLGT